MDIVEFLRARLDEDEAVARGGADPYVLAERHGWVPVGAEWEHVARHGDPARVLREVEAKRRIIQEHVDQVEMDDPCVPIVAGERLLRHLGAVYADHPDYDPEWAD